MKRTIFIGLMSLAIIVAVVLALSQAGTPVTAQTDSTPFGVHWDEWCDIQAVAPEYIKLYIDLEVRCGDDGAVAVQQTLDLNGPALELGEGLFREYNWDWGGWTPLPGMTCTEWQRVRWEVPDAAGAVLDGEIFAGQIYGEYWPKEGEETREDADHFWLLGPLAEEWYDTCPGAPDCATPGPTLTPRPTLMPQPTLTPRPTDVPEPEPTCRLTPTCPPSWPTEPPYLTTTPYPTATRYPTNTPWPTQPPFS